MSLGEWILLLLGLSSLGAMALLIHATVWGDRR